MPDENLARAIASGTRREILRLLVEREISVHKAAEKLELSEVNASKHLKKLYDLGLLDTRVHGRERLYSLGIPRIKTFIQEYDIVSAKIKGLKYARK